MILDLILAPFRSFGLSFSTLFRHRFFNGFLDGVFSGFYTKMDPKRLPIQDTGRTVVPFWVSLARLGDLFRAFSRLFSFFLRFSADFGMENLLFGSQLRRAPAVR